MKTNTPDPDASLNVKAAAAFLAISPRAITALAQQGQIAASRIGVTGRGRWTFTRADLMAFRESRRSPTVAERLESAKATARYSAAG